MSHLEKKRCIPCEGGIPAVDLDQAMNLLQQLQTSWQISADGKQLYQDFHFENYYQTMAFVNALAWMAHDENHHPDLEVGYNHCLVRYTTHAVSGLTENDFICAHKAERIFNHSA
jgi:4a-hydroxytetrahydrobiopterin dehydratase